MLRIGTSERDGTFHSQGKSLAKVLARQRVLAPVEVLESHSASMQNAYRLHEGSIEFGFMASNWIGRARNGEPPFTHAVAIAMAAPMNCGPLFFVSAADSSIRVLQDLRGRRVAVGPKESGMVQHARCI